MTAQIKLEGSPIPVLTNMGLYAHLQQATRSTIAKLTLPFPARLPAKDILARRNETGFDEKHVEGGLDTTWMCGICRGLPRRTATLNKCGHIFCEMCIRQHFDMVPHAANVPIHGRGARCPYCRQPYRLTHIRTWTEMHPWSQNAYKARIVRCPNKCGFKGNPFAVDEHEMYLCPLRIISCPNEGCHEEGRALYIELAHFLQCGFLKAFCPVCNLAGLAGEIESHDCIKALRESLTCMFLNDKT